VEEDVEELVLVLLLVEVQEAVLAALPILQAFIYQVEV
jgi:hypothetical protein